MTDKGSKQGVDYSIEWARPGDEEAISSLIHALACYEKAPEQCKATPELLREYLFGENPITYSLVARVGQETVGMAIYFLTFPTWPCKPCMHLEDLFVLPEFRKSGIGGALLRRLGQVCVERGYERLEWACLEWNELAKSQYRKIGAEPMEEWRTWRMDGAALAEFGKPDPKSEPREQLPDPSKVVKIYTDGGCQPNPGVGGWAAILIHGDTVKELVGGADETTNNRMEMLAAINGLEALKRSCTVELHTDSQYLKNGITKWMKNWKKNNWTRGKEKEPVKNADLWKRLDEATQRHDIRWAWLRGHTGDHYNERCDELCTQEIERRRK